MHWIPSSLSPSAFSFNSVSLDKIGSTHDSVFPKPVGAMTKTSLPSRIKGIAFFWISVNSEMPFARASFKTSG